MALRTEETKVLDLLIQHEESISVFYGILSHKFPAQHQFWQILSEEELIHSSWIKKLYPKVKQGHLQFDINKFNIDTIAKSLAHVEEQIGRFKNEDLSEEEALSTAMYIETLPIESKFFEVYSADSPQLTELLRSLEEAFTEHRDKIKAVLDKNS